MVIWRHLRGRFARACPEALHASQTHFVGTCSSPTQFRWYCSSIVSYILIYLAVVCWTYPLSFAARLPTFDCHFQIDARIHHHSAQAAIEIPNLTRGSFSLTAARRFGFWAWLLDFHNKAGNGWDGDCGRFTVTWCHLIVILYVQVSSNAWI